MPRPASASAATCRPYARQCGAAHATRHARCGGAARWTARWAAATSQRRLRRGQGPLMRAPLGVNGPLASKRGNSRGGPLMGACDWPPHRAWHDTLCLAMPGLAAAAQHRRRIGASAARSTVCAVHSVYLVHCDSVSILSAQRAPALSMRQGPWPRDPAARATVPLARAPLPVRSVRPSLRRPRRSVSSCRRAPHLCARCVRRRQHVDGRVCLTGAGSTSAVRRPCRAQR